MSPGTAAAFHATFPGCAPAKIKNEQNLANPLSTADGKDFSPMDRTLGDVAPRTCSGDEPDSPHAIFFDPDRHQALRSQIRTPSEP